MPDWGAGEHPDREAKCRKHPLPTNHNVNADTDPWFYDPEEAAKICNGTNDGRICPFLQECLHISLVNNDQVGCYGGLVPVQRRWVRRNVPRDEWDDFDIRIVPPPEYFLEEHDEDEDGNDAEEDEDTDEVSLAAQAYGLDEEFRGDPEVPDDLAG